MTKLIMLLREINSIDDEHEICSKELCKRIVEDLKKSPDISIDGLIEMTKFVLNRRGQVGRTLCDLILCGFSAALNDLVYDESEAESIVSNLLEVSGKE